MNNVWKSKQNNLLIMEKRYKHDRNNTACSNFVEA